MNKLRLIKIYELRGKIHPIEQIVIDLLDGIDGIKEEPHLDYIFYKKDGITYFDYNLDHNNIHLYFTICSIFKYPYKETKAIMIYLLEKHLNITINDID